MKQVEKIETIIIGEDGIITGVGAIDEVNELLANWDHEQELKEEKVMIGKKCESCAMYMLNGDTNTYGCIAGVEQECLNKIEEESVMNNQTTNNEVVNNKEEKEMINTNQEVKVEKNEEVIAMEKKLGKMTKAQLIAMVEELQAKNVELETKNAELEIKNVAQAERLVKAENYFRALKNKGVAPSQKKVEAPKADPKKPVTKMQVPAGPETKLYMGKTKVQPKVYGKCVTCGCEIKSENVAKYSKENYGAVYCFSCGKTHRKELANQQQ